MAFCRRCWESKRHVYYYLFVHSFVGYVMAMQNIFCCGERSDTIIRERMYHGVCCLCQDRRKLGVDNVLWACRGMRGECCRRRWTGGWTLMILPDAHVHSRILAQLLFWKESKLLLSWQLFTLLITDYLHYYLHYYLYYLLHYLILPCNGCEQYMILVGGPLYRRKRCGLVANLRVSCSRWQLTSPFTFLDYF